MEVFSEFSEIGVSGQVDKKMSDKEKAMSRHALQTDMLEYYLKVCKCVMDCSVSLATSLF